MFQIKPLVALSSVCLFIDLKNLFFHICFSLPASGEIVEIIKKRKGKNPSFLLLFETKFKMCSEFTAKWKKRKWCTLYYLWCLQFENLITKCKETFTDSKTLGKVTYHLWKLDFLTSIEKCVVNDNFLWEDSFNLFLNCICKKTYRTTNL